MVEKIHLHVEVSAPNLTRTEAIRRWRALGNPMLDTAGDTIIAVDETHTVTYTPEYDYPAFAFIYKCDFCDAHHHLQEVVDAHERTAHGVTP